jgi:hypothetical protein
MPTKIVHSKKPLIKRTRAAINKWGYAINLDHTPWEDPEVLWISKHCKTMTIYEMQAAVFPYRTINAIRNKGNKQGFSMNVGSPLSDAEIKALELQHAIAA